MGKRVKPWRKKLAEVDASLLALLNQRAGIIRSLPGAELPAKLSSLSRETLSAHQGEFSKKAASRVFEEIDMGMAPLRAEREVVFLGPEDTFTHQAASAYFDESWTYSPCDGLENVFRRVESGDAMYGVVPAENTMVGVVSHTLDLLLEASLEIVGEIVISIDHYLLSRESSLEQVREVYSHPQALAQCRPWVSSNMIGVKLREASSTAEAASKARRKKQSAAIASRWAAERYGLSILAAQIDKVSGVEQNITRFLVLGCHSTSRTGEDKTSIAFAVKHEVGALAEILKPFSKYGISLLKIESRPSRKTPWEYSFYVDLEGHVEDSGVRRALRELRKYSQYYKLLGSYPRAGQ